MMRWLAESEVMNEQHDLVVSMKDCWEASMIDWVFREILIVANVPVPLPL